MQISRGDKRQTTGGWNIQTFSGGKCHLDVFTEDGVPFSYVFRCDEVLYAPVVNVVQDQKSKEVIDITFSYNRVFADIEGVKRVEDITREIREFFLACREAEVFQNKEAAG